MSLENENTSDFERQNTIGKAMNSAPAMEGNGVTHENMMEFEHLWEASGERNLRCINLTHGADSVVSGAFEPLLDMGRERDSVSRLT